MIKRCTNKNCKEINPIFRKDKYRSDGLTSRCLVCLNKKSLERYYNNREKCLKDNKKWREENKEKYSQKRKKTNKKRRKKIREYERLYYANNPSARIAKNLRVRLSNLIKGRIKIGSAIKDCGCSVKELKDYFQSKFETGMTWENYGNGEGKWNIDHIIPLSKFDLTNREDFLKACHYTNLQSMWWYDNLKKRNK